jgi:TonB-dependent SusC/RagA subfamily outer membrane receptor
MSRPPRRVSLPDVTPLLASAAILVSAACHHARPAALQPGVRDGQEVRRFAGVDIVPTNAGFLIRIHSGSVGNGEPLYVIDGTPMKIPPQRGIDWFKPEDIAEVKVLKYPYELAEYGLSGANGVIVITTKQNPAAKRR